MPCVAFHPTAAQLFVATQTLVRIYDLKKKVLAKKLTSGAKWISSISVHPQGDNVVIGTYDKRLIWFDLDMSNKAYRTLRYHEKALRSVQFHRSYPLLASCGDDGKIHIFHSRVYADLSKSPMIVPLKVLRGHAIVSGLSVLDCQFHPTQPWIFTAGADGSIILFQSVHT